MRYINKGEEPAFMEEWKDVQLKAGLPLAYRDFRDKSKLNEVLRSVQHGICCYCEKCIDHFQGAKERGAHNEHLVPEQGPNGVFEMQMDYGNLYACCIESRGKAKANTHCGEHKKDGVIFPFIQQEDCNSCFKYNVLGEILPNGDYSKWEQYRQNVDSLDEMAKKAVNAIDVLNLNCASLVNERKELLLILMKWANKSDAQTIRNKMSNYESRHLFPEFIDMRLYFMRKKCGE